MSSTYTPDNWQIVEIKANDTGEVHHRVLADWQGGYLHGSSWKLSSGFEAIYDDGDEWRCPQSSGSTYFLRKHSQRMSGYMSGIFSNFVQNAKEATLTIKDFDEIKDIYLKQP